MIWGKVYDFLVANSNWEFEPAELYEVPDDFILSKRREKKDDKGEKIKT
jgi:hypothetical protein